jgi:hypothetical protein
LKSQDIAEIEKEILEKQVQAGMQRLLLLTMAYNRCLSEINNLLVEDRCGLAKVIYEYNSMTASSCEPLVLKFSVAKLIESTQHLSAEILQKYHRGNMSSKSPIRKQYRQFSVADGSLHDTLCEALIPPSIAFRQLPQPPSQNGGDTDAENLDEDSSTKPPPLSEEEFDNSFNEEVFDVSDFLSSGINEYENSINQLHRDTKKQLLDYFLEELTTATANANSAVSDNSPSRILLPILHTLLGYAYHNVEDFRQALVYYAKSNLINQLRVSHCILQLFIQDIRIRKEDFAENFSEPRFIANLFEIKSSVGMHAYRLILELTYAELKTNLDRRDSMMAATDSSISLGSFRSFFRSGNALAGKVVRQTR